MANIDFSDLKKRLDGCYSSASRTFQMASGVLSSSSVDDLLLQTIRIGALTVSDSDGPAVTANRIALQGVADVLGMTNVRVEAVFYLSEEPIGSAELTLRVLLPSQWQFVDTWPVLRRTVFDGLDFASEPAKSLLLSSRAYIDSETRLPVAAGQNFYGALKPTGKIFGTVGAILGELVQVTVLGPIVNGVGGPAMHLSLNYLASLHKYFPDLDIPVDVALVSRIDDSGLTGVIGLQFSASFQLGSVGVTLSTMLNGAQTNVVSLDAKFEGLALPSPAELMRLIGGNGDIVSTLPDRYQHAGAVTIKQLRFGLNVSAPTVTSVEIEPWPLFVTNTAVFV